MQLIILSLTLSLSLSLSLSPSRFPLRKQRVATSQTPRVCPLRVGRVATREQALLELRRPLDVRAVQRRRPQPQHLPQLVPELLGGKVVDEGVQAAVEGGEAQRQLVRHVEGVLVEEPPHRVRQQQHVAGGEAEDKDQQHGDRQPDGPVLLRRLGVPGQLADDAEVAEDGDAERQEEEQDEHGEEEAQPGGERRQRVPLQHVEAGGDAQLGDVEGEVGGHQRVQHGEHRRPHQQAGQHRRALPRPELPELDGPEDAQVAVRADGRHGQDGAVHVGEEADGQEPWVGEGQWVSGERRWEGSDLVFK